MEELKPVAWKLTLPDDSETVITDIKSYSLKYYTENGYNPVPLYAIPDGCVAVPNGAVEKAFRDGFMHSGEGYNGELYCDGWTKVIDGFKEAASEYRAALADATFPRVSVVDEEV